MSSARSPRTATERSTAADALDRLIAEELARPAPGPDMTSAIMRRLGFVHMSARRARARNWSLWTARAGLAAAALAAVVLGVQLHAWSPQALRPSGLTIPAALDADVQRHERHWNQLIRQLRELAPAHDDCPSDPVAPQEDHHMSDDVNRSAIAPVMWA